MAAARRPRRYRQNPDAPGRSWYRNHSSGVAANSSGDRNEARVCLMEAVTTARAVGDLRTLSLALELLGHVDETELRFEDARSRHAEALELAVEARDSRLQIHAHIHLGLVSLAQHREIDAGQHFEAALTVRHVGYHQCGALVGLAQLAARKGSFERALRLHGAASRDRWDTVLYRTDHAHLERQPWIGAAQGALGREAAADAWSAGAAMTPEQAISYALSDAGEPPGEGGPLTRREKEIVVLVAQGLRNREIAGQLVISPRTVDAHIEHIRNKLGLQSRVQVVGWASAQGLLKN
jgi:DNA-binding CsgD family transcriptional regulator